MGFNVDSLALVSCLKTGSFCISKFDFSWATDRAYARPFFFVNLRKSVLHTCQVHTVLVLEHRKKSR